MFFNLMLGTLVLAIAIAILLFTGWKAYRLIRANPDVFKTLPESEKELSLKDFPTKLIIVLVAAFIIAVIGDLNVFSFNPFMDTLLFAALLLLLAYYFLQKRRLRRK